MLYNAALVSAIQQCESAVKYTHAPALLNLPASPHPHSQLVDFLTDQLEGTEESRTFSKDVRPLPEAFEAMPLGASPRH